jgi:hypothetical protein
VSKGHGKWERAILDALDGVTAFYLIDLLPEKHSRAATVALNRAARNLHAAGKIEIVPWLPAAGEPGYLTVYRKGYPAPSREHITRLKGCIGREQ